MYIKLAVPHVTHVFSSRNSIELSAVSCWNKLQKALKLTRRLVSFELYILDLSHAIVAAAAIITIPGIIVLFQGCFHHQDGDGAIPLGWVISRISKRHVVEVFPQQLRAPTCSTEYATDTFGHTSTRSPGVYCDK